MKIKGCKTNITSKKKKKKEENVLAGHFLAGHYPLSLETIVLTIKNTHNIKIQIKHL